MNSQSSAVAHPHAETISSSKLSATQPFYWSVRRELWENRFIYIAPLAVATVALLGFIGSSIVGIWELPLRLNVSHATETPYDLVSDLLMGTGIIVAVFYSLDALHGERRDRSILFWKSLPVSDLTTVLSKAVIPIFIVPLLIFVISVAAHWIMLLFSSAILLVTGQSVAALWTNLSVPRMWLILLYHLIAAHGIWPAPVYAWLLLVSAWPRRATFLWAALPIVSIAGVERLVFHTFYFARMVGFRLIGNAPIFAPSPEQVSSGAHMNHMTPGVFLSSPGFWLGLGITVLFLAAAVRLRRSRGPI